MGYPALTLLNGLIFVALLGVICGVVFVLFYLRPLHDHEIIQLASKRRNKQIRSYFVFDNREYDPDQSFKKSMNPDGRFYAIDESLVQFPSVAAALLKYKKHEWIILAFETTKRVKAVWLNKGIDRTQVSLRLSMEFVTALAKGENYSSVLVFHNHPNTNPNYLDCRQASNQDMLSAQSWSKHLNQCGINLLEFVCERGRHYEYFRAASTSFFPIGEFVSKIEELNGKTRPRNFMLHFERLF